MTARPQIVLAVLAAVALAALVLAQRLKGEPAYVRLVHVTPVFTPNRDGFRDRATISLKVGRSDVVSVSVVDASGRVVRRLATARHLRAGRELKRRWYGRTDAGRRAPEGTYTVRVTLRERAKTIDLIEKTRLRRLRGHAKGVA